MDNGFSMIRYIIGSSRIKFSILENLYAPIRLDKYKLMVMYIDAHSIFYRLYRNSAMELITDKNKPMIIRDMVIGFWNVIGHYRRFMATRLHMDNDIFVMFNRRKSEYHSSLIHGYNSNLIHRYDKDDKDYGLLNELVDESWKYICSISPYIEGVYCLTNDGIDDFALMKKIGFDNPNCYYTIFTKNSYAMQFIGPNVSMLVNKRDDSYLLTHKNWLRDGILRGKKSDGVSTLFQPQMLPLAWAFVGCSDVSVKHTRHIMQLPNMMRKMSNHIETEELFADISFESFMELIENDFNTGKLAVQSDKTLLINRYKAFSGYLSAASISKDKMMKVMAQCIDIFDENELEKLNNILASGSDNPEVLDLTNLNMSNGIGNYYNNDWEG